MHLNLYSKKVVNNKKLNFSQALDALEKEGLKMPPSLKNGLNNLYGYASAEDGIRHGSFQKSKLDIADARLMLVLSSTLINYLVVKLDVAKVG